MSQPVSSASIATSVARAIALLLGLLFVAASATDVSAQTDCSEGTVLSDDGVTCEPAGGDSTGPCPEGQRLDAAGLVCEEIVESVGSCPPGERPNGLGTACEPIPDADGPGCETGFSLGADGSTCIAIGPRCAQDEVLGDDGECVRSFRCPSGLILASDLLSCLSDGCPAGEVPSVDGKRCLTPDTDCPDGSPRPAGGSCLVVETVEGEDGVQVIVRCEEADAFCQARVKQCAEERAAGDGEGGDSCEDPRTTCSDAEASCEEANERLVECAIRGLGDDEGEDGAADDEADSAAPDGQPVRFDPCDDLCPPLHALDAAGECTEYLDPLHPCVSFGQLPGGVETNAELDGFAYLAGTGECVTKVEFLRRLDNFEAAAGAEAEALALLRETTAAYLTADERIAELDAARIRAENDVRLFAEAAADADTERIQNEKELHQTRKFLEREQRVLEAEVLQVYVTGGPDAAIEAALLAVDDVNDIGLVQSYGRALLDNQIDNIDRIRALEAASVALGVELERAAAEVQQALDAAIEARASIAEVLTMTEELRVEQLSRRAEEAAMVAQLREDKGRYAQELGVFDQASREIADIVSESELLVTEFADFDGLFANPVAPAVVVSGFGPRLHPILGYVRNHNGLDFDANFGEPIYASASGIVQIASTFGGYGETVVLDHGGGLLTLYAHMSLMGAGVGDEIRRGDIIGFIGSTGLSTGPHLHFEVWVDGRTAVDPRPYLTGLDN